MANLLQLAMPQTTETPKSELSLEATPAVKSRQSKTISDKRCLRCGRRGRKRLNGRYIRIHSHKVRPNHAKVARGIEAKDGRGHIFHMVSIKVS